MRNLPPNYKTFRHEARRARAYHALSPYPQFAFKNWKSEDRGSLPICRPFVRHIVMKGSRWLFGQPVRIQGESEEATNAMMEIWLKNQMQTKMMAGCRIAAQSGSIALKFSYDAKNPVCPVNISVLDGVEYVQWFYDPHDVDVLEMVRIQYPYWNDDKGKWMWHREEWTDKTQTMYKPVEVMQQGPLAEILNKSDLVDNEKSWEKLSEKKNPFGVIPVVQIKNQESGGPWGVGDLWGLFPSIDHINMAYDLMQKHNQLGVWPKKVYIDLMDEGDVPIFDGPGASEDLMTASTAKHQGKVQQFEVKGEIREHMERFANALVEEVYDSAGSVRIRPDTITNKGNLTQAVLTQMYAPLIEMTREKRECYGENGLARFFKTLGIGLSNIGKGWGESEINIAWPEFFDLTEHELQTLVDRKAIMVSEGFTTREAATKDVARAEGIDPLSAWDEAKETEPDPDRVRVNNGKQQNNGNDTSEKQSGNKSDTVTRD